MSSLPALFVGVVVLFIIACAVVDYRKFRKHEALKRKQGEPTP